MGLLHQLVQVTSLLPALVQGGRWVFLGGFSGLEEGGDRVGEINNDHDVDGDVGDDVEDDAGDDVEDGVRDFSSFCYDLIAKGFWPCRAFGVDREQCKSGEKQVWRQVPKLKVLLGMFFCLGFNLAMRLSPKLRFALLFRFEWCSGNFSKAPIDLGGHTMSEVVTKKSFLFDYLRLFRLELTFIQNPQINQFSETYMTFDI